MVKLVSKNSKKKLFCGNNQKLLIVADCAKSEHLVHFFDCARGRYLYKRPLKVKNNLSGYDFLRQKSQSVLDQMGLKSREVNFVMEDPASYSQEFIYFLQQEGFNVLYVNALRASRYRENTRASSDTLDLDGIVRSALMGQTYQTDVINTVYSKLKESHRERCRLVKENTKHKNIIHGQIDQLFPGFLCQAKSGIHGFSKACVELMLCKNFGPQMFLKANSKTTYKLIKKAGFNEPEKVQSQLSALAAECVDLTKLEPEVIHRRCQRLQKQLLLYKMRDECIKYEEQVMAELLQKTPYALLTSITGAGIITVAAIAAELGDPVKWPDADRIASYAGIVPRQKQSGGSQKGPITTAPPKAANKYLKNALMTIVTIAKENQHRGYKSTGVVHPLKAHFDQVMQRGGATYTASAKKLVRIMLALLRDETIYLPDIKQNPPEVYRQWVEDGSDRMLEKWRSRGIHPSDENYLGKWLKNKEVILKLIDQ